MLFEPEAIERLSPAARVEVQDFYARKFLAARERRIPDRRTVTNGATAEASPAVAADSAARSRWPHGVWFRNDTSRRARAEPQAAGGRP
jgi:hypothetical protein